MFQLFFYPHMKSVQILTPIFWKICMHYLINCNLRFSPLSLSLKSFAPFTSAQWFSFLLNLYILTHSLKWYKDDIEFFTYIPRMRDGMKQRFFDVPGVQIDVST